jgi:hypothetical protein
MLHPGGVQILGLKDRKCLISTCLGDELLFILILFAEKFNLGKYVGKYVDLKIS